MEAINALGLKPICLLPDKSSKPKRVISIPHLKFPTSSTTNQQNLPNTLSRILHGNCLILLSPFLAPKLGFALTYEEALQQSINSSSGGEFDTGGGSFDGIVNFATENPIVIGGALAILAVPLIVSQFLGKPKPFGVESAKIAYGKLGDDPTAQLLDIRSLKDVKEMGSPDIRGLKKKPVSIVYKGDDKPGFLQKLALKFKEPENTTLFIIDKFDGNSELVAELVTANGFKAAYAIKDGAEGARGWMNSGLPWILPKKSFSLDFGNLTEVFSGSLPDSSEALPLALGLVAATGLGVLAFTEIETILQVLGSAAIIQVLSKKLLFAEDRKQTLQQVDEFLNTKIAPKELVSDVKEIGAALLPLQVKSKALPAPAEASSEASSPESAPQKTESITEEKLTEEKVEAVSAPAPASGINSVPQTEVKAESGSGIQRPLSPYYMYPDLKPPSSPRPSHPSLAPNPTPIPTPAPETNSIPITEAKAESDSGIDRPLSPYHMYPDLKPPSSPRPSQPSSAPAPAPAPETNSIPITEAKAETNSIPITEAKAETSSIPIIEANAESHSGIDRPLSPYPLYPDLKLPSSPCPSQP